MDDDVARTLLASLSRTGRPGRVLARLAPLEGITTAVETKRLRAQLRRLEERMAAARTAFYRSMWESAAVEVGARSREADGGFLEIHRGRSVTYVRENLVELDNPVTLEFAGDRGLAAGRLERAGLPVSDHLGFTLDHSDAALTFLRRHGRCVIKPARGTGGGNGVTCDVRSPSEFVRAALTAARHCPDLVIERQLDGREHRLLVLDGEVVGAVRRRPPTVTGDGRSTATELMVAENLRRAQAGGSDGLYLLRLSLDAGLALSRQGLNPRSVPTAGRRIEVAGAVNAGAGRDCEPERPPPVLVDAAREAVRALELRWASVEMACPDPQHGFDHGGGIIEVNSTPGLSYHYHVRDPAKAQPVAAIVLDTLLGAPDVRPQSGLRGRLGPDQAA